jgi:hypothetical protein
LLRALVRQFREKVTGIFLTLLDVPSGNLAPVKSLADNYLAAGGEYDAYFSDLMPELSDRRNRHLADSGAVFEPLVIAIGDLGSFFDAANNETMKRLAAITTLGRGLNVPLLTVGNVDDITKLYHGDPFTAGMADKAAAVLLGGSFKSHGVFKADIPYTESERPLGSGEGYLLTQGKLKKFKAVTF